MKLDETFDVTNYDELIRFTPIPAGKYKLQIENSEMRETKAGDGSYLVFAFSVVEGEYKGRKIWQNFTWMNPSEKAVRIGRAQLGGLVRACGKQTIEDTDALNSCVVFGDVRVRRSEQYGDSYEIKRFYPLVQETTEQESVESL